MTLTAGKNTGAIILAAGMGTRMKSARHKVLHQIGGLPMIGHLMSALDQMGVEKRVVVVGALREQLEAALSRVEFVVQEPQLGTGHAVQCAEAAFAGHTGIVLILYGDVPFVSAETLERMVNALDSADLVVLGFRPGDAAHYGRLVTDGDGALVGIVEFNDATNEERSINLCNSGIISLKVNQLFDLLSALDNNNSKGEYYLTDIVGLARERGLTCAIVETSEDEVMGINSRQELARAEAIFQQTRREEAMAEGVTLEDPSSVYFAHDTILGRDVVIEPNVVFRNGVKIGDRVTIRAHSHLEGATVGDGASIGPFARLRPGAHIGEGAKVGNFVEIKKSDIGEGAKVSHLSYIGDARIGAGANIGAGTITCNYDGFDKFVTEVGANAFIGSNTSLVAPVKIGAGAIVGAGSVITRDVEADALAVERAKRTDKPEWARRFRQARKKSKE